MNNTNCVPYDSDVFISCYRKARKDNEGFYIITCTNTKRWFCATTVFYEIISLCDGINSLKNIVDTMGNRFPDIPYEKIRMDVQNALMRAKELCIITERGRNS